MGPFFQTQSNPVPGWIQSMSTSAEFYGFSERGSSAPNWLSDEVTAAAAGACCFSPLSPALSIQSTLALSRRASVSLSGMIAVPPPTTSVSVAVVPLCSPAPRTCSLLPPAGRTSDGSDLYRIAGRPSVPQRNAVQKQLQQQ